jgi:predicted O-methyltransferase YrrM
MAVNEHAARLRRLLATVKTEPTPRPARRPSADHVAPSRPASEPLRVYELIADGGLPFDGWQVGPTLAVELAEYLDRTRPGALLQLGCGSSTAVLAAHIARRGGTLTVVDHDTTRISRTRERLNRLGLADFAQLVSAGLTEFHCPDGKDRPWYDIGLVECFDFILIDGPPLNIGREAVMFAVNPHLAEAGEVWLHDAHRPHERRCLDLWRGHLRLQWTVHTLDDRGVAILRREAVSTPFGRIPDGMAVSLLTGCRPELLRRSIESLVEGLPGLFEQARVTAFVNGDDADSAALLDRLPGVDRVLRNSGRRLPIGQAASHVVAEAVKPTGVRYLLHLEDDWEVSTLDVTWLARAAAILDSEPRIGQVRLRHRGERVRTRHMVTGQRIHWEESAGYLLSASAHWTFNPSLMRADAVSAAWPADDEAAAQRRFFRSGLWSAQLTPGVFRHIG